MSWCGRQQRFGSVRKHDCKSTSWIIGARRDFQIAQPLTTTTSALTGEWCTRFKFCCFSIWCQSGSMLLEAVELIELRRQTFGLLNEHTQLWLRCTWLSHHLLFALCVRVLPEAKHKEFHQREEFDVGGRKQKTACAPRDIWSRTKNG